ncbi:hypothetical protein IscW_ISCW023713 [Ixodes scapularis]|uniref:Uncharacterized protein n=1 Tax=Ixodes scapularis TaxID=6945 RepID=B7QI56_IXOSC|nr:hypothetical protein IscW_ISCW023713 [Ixodes scapularis]|eukprot:XP_002414863.1 hypothetical protein IscW_ISCW023713 [Ixodes scapularis]
MNLQTRTWSIKTLTPTSPAILGMIQARSWEQTVSYATCQLVHASIFLKVPCGRKPQLGISAEGTVLSLCKYIVSHFQETSIDQAHSKCHGTKCKHILKGDHFTKYRCNVSYSDLKKMKQQN